MFFATWQPSPLIYFWNMRFLSADNDATLFPMRKGCLMMPCPSLIDNFGGVFDAWVLESGQERLAVSRTIRRLSRRTEKTFRSCLSIIMAKLISSQPPL